jgi:hypothetical protein
MGVLEDLKAEAEAREARDSALASLAAETREEAIRVLQPAMSRIYNYLKDLLTQMERLERQVMFDYTLKGVGKLKGLRHKDYILARCFEDRDVVEGFNLRFQIHNGRRYKVRIADRAVALELIKEFREREVKFKVHEQTSATAPTLLEFLADFIAVLEFRPGYMRKAVDLTVKNYSTLGTEGCSFAAKTVDDNFLDNLARFVMREPNELFSLKLENLSDDLRDKLRAKLEEEGRGKFDPERTITPHDEKGKSSLFSRLLGRD